MADEQAKVRLDKWLWAARFYKTRALAAEAIEGGKVEVGGSRVKRSKLVQVADSIRLRLGPYEHIVNVTGLSERRGPASVAATLYSETEESKKTREELQFKMKVAAPQFAFDSGRPSKKQRRDIEKLRRDRG
ncbi:MAG: S4 domain-containing protein [Gemmatimonadota bacterium]|nr:S4 domain-containing protein [Gemmatimonadota bacterium]